MFLCIGIHPYIMIALTNTSRFLPVFCTPIAEYRCSRPSSTSPSYSLVYFDHFVNRLASPADSAAIYEQGLRSKNQNKSTAPRQRLPPHIYISRAPSSPLLNVHSNYPVLIAHKGIVLVVATEFARFRPKGEVA